MDERELLDEIKDNYNDSSPILQPFWGAADLDLRLYVGDQYQWMRDYCPSIRTNMLIFNNIHKSIKWASGYQRKHRLASIVTSTNGGDERTATQYSKALGWQMQEENGYNILSDAFEWALASRLNFVQLWMDFRTDPLNGKICYERLSYNQIAFDPWFTKPNMSDCGWILARRWMNRSAVISLYPDLENNINELMRFNNRYGQDMRFLFMPQAAQYKQKGLFAYDEYWRRTYRKEHKIVDRETGEMYDWEFTKKEFYQFREQMPFAELITVEVPTIERHVLVNGYPIHEEKSPWGLDEYPFVPVFCYFNPDSIDSTFRFTSFTSVVKDAQLEINRRRNKILDILDSQVNSGLIVKEGALVRLQDAYMTGQGRVITIRKEYDVNADVKIMQPPPLPAGDYQMQELMAAEVQNLLGLNDNAMGDSDSSNVAGITEMLRQQAAQNGSQGVFDSLNMSQKILGDRTLDLITQNWTPRKIASITNEEPTEHFYMDKRERCYQCIVEQGILTTTQRQLEFLQLVQLRQMELPIPDEDILAKAPIQGKQDLIDKMNQAQQQAQQQQQMQMQLEQQKLASEFKLLDATATERYTRGVSNIGLAQERVAKSAEDRAQADLDRAKAIKEMQTMDANNIQTISNIVANMEAQDQARQNLELQKMEQESAQVGKQQGAV